MTPRKDREGTKCFLSWKISNIFLPVNSYDKNIDKYLKFFLIFIFFRFSSLNLQYKLISHFYVGTLIGDNQYSDRKIKIYSLAYSDL